MEYLQDQRGLTLIEVIVAMVLILILVTAFTGAISTSLQREVEVDRSLMATDLAAGVIEFFGESGDNKDIVRDIYENHDEDITFAEFLYEFDNSDIEVLMNDLEFVDSFRKDDSIISVDEYDGNPDLYRVTVDIYWEEPGVEDRKESITSLIFVPDTDNDED